MMQYLSFFKIKAPHQPRLDWQMWFAALGSYQRDPWIIHLMYRLLIGQKEGRVHHNPYYIIITVLISFAANSPTPIH